MDNYYVYTLRHPDGLVFYVGRGQGNYWINHEDKARRQEKCTLTTIIRKIWDQDQQIQKCKERENLTEEEAYTYQVELHSKYSIENPEMHYPGSHPRSIGHGKNIGKARKAKGYTHSEATIKKISQSLAGKKYSEERYARNIERMSHPKHLNTRKVIAKRAKTKTGVPRPPRVRAILSEAQKRYYASLTEDEKVAYLQPWIIRTLRDTKIEQIVEETLKASGVAYEKQYHVSIYISDFYIPSTNTLIEVNGCFVHQCPICGWNNRRTEEIWMKDARKKAFLEARGYIVKIIWEHDIEGHKVRLPKKKGNDA